MANCSQINNTTITGTSAFIYDGTPLPCTDIKTCDDLNTILAKLDAVVCTTVNSVNTLIEEVTNITEDVMIITEDVININNQLDICCPTTTTTSSTSTSTSTSTTTSTTTIPPTSTTTSTSTSTSTSTTTSTSTSTTSTSSSTTTTTTTVACGCYEWNLIIGEIDVVESPPVTVTYIDCAGEIVDRPNYIAIETTICVQASTLPVLYRADEPAGLVDSSVTITSNCCGTPPTTTTTTTPAPVENINYRVTACVGGNYYNMPKAATSFSIGEVLQFTAPFDGFTIIHCGTITSITWPNNATDAYLYGPNAWECGDMTHCEIPV